MKRILTWILVFAMILPNVQYTYAAEATDGNTFVGDTVSDGDVAGDDVSGGDMLDVKITGQCGDNLSYEIDLATGTLTISGTGAMSDYTFVADEDTGDVMTSAPWGQYSEQLTTLVIGEDVTSIGDYAFFYCSNFTSNLELPEGLVRIGENAFARCSSFTGDLVIPDTVTELELGAFIGCSGFNGNLVISNGITTIARTTFQDCSGLEGNLVIPEGVKTIGEFAFQNCSGFDGNLTIASSVTSIDNSAFMNCSGLIGNLVIPVGITAIGNAVFYGCSGFTGNLVIPEGVTSIGVSAFLDCSGFDGNLMIPEGVTSVGVSAFHGCSGLTGNLEIPQSLTTISGHMFRDCTGFENYTITIPDSVTTIVEDAFVKYLNDEYQNLDITIRCNKGSYADTWAKENGFKVVYIAEGDVSDGNASGGNITGQCGENLTYEIDLTTGTLTISGTGPMSDFEKGYDQETGENYTLAPWGQYRKELTTLILGEGITTIGEKAFSGCSSFTGDLIIPESVTAIGMSAFESCSGFTGNLIIPEGVTVIEGWAFFGCRGFDGSLVIPDGVTWIRVSAFSGCSGLTGNLVIPEGVTTINSWAFHSCTGLEGGTITLPDSLTQIDNYTFMKYVEGGEENLSITIRCNKNTYADTWATDNGFEIEYIDGDVSGGDEDTQGLADELFPDDIFRNYLKNTLGISEDKRLTSEALETIEDLRISTDEVSAPIKSIEGIQYLKNLTFLALEGHDVKDASMLSELTKLENIWMDSNELTDLPDFSNSNVQDWYNTSFVNNCIDPESITLDKTPVNMIEREFFVQKNKESQRRDFRYKIPTEFYLFNGKNPFLIEVDGFKGGRSYTLTIDMGNVRKEKTFSQEGAYVTNMWNYQKHVFVVEDMGLDIGEYTAHITLTDCYGNIVLDVPEWTFSIKPDEEKTYSYNMDTLDSYVVVDSVKIEGSFTKDDIQSIKLVDKDGNVLESISDQNNYDCVSSTIYEEDRYDDIFGRDIQIELSKECLLTDVFMVFTFKNYLAVGSYDVVIETQNETYTCEDLVKVVEAVDEIQTGTLGEKIQWSYSKRSNKMRVFGEGAIYDYDIHSCEGYNGVETDSPMNDFRGIAGMTLEIEQGITKIGKYSFYGLNYLVGDLTIPEGVTEIGEYAFADGHYSGVMGGTLTIPSTVKTIHARAFACNSKYTGLVITDGVETIGESAFMYWWGIEGTTVKLPDSLKEIAVNAFADIEGNLDVTFECTKGSYAETWAQANGFHIVYAVNEIFPEDIPEDGVPEGLWIADIDDCTYTGAKLTPEVHVYDGNKKLENGKDYTLTYKNNQNAEDASAEKAPKVIVTGKGNYKGKKERTFTINSKVMTEGNTESKEILLFANEKVQQPAPVIYVDGVKLKKNKDYILLYEDTQEGAYVEPGTWSIMVKGIGNYGGAVEFDFRILENTRIKAEKLTISGLKTVSYEEGVPAEPKPIVKYKGTTLEEGIHYSLRYEDNTKAGKATLILTGLEKEGEYNIVGTVTKTFKVKGVQIGKASIDYQKVVTYNGAEQKPKVTLTYKDDTLLEGRDYHVTYTNNQKVGTATIMITGDKGFEGSIKKTFKINPEPVDEKNLRITFVSGEAEFAYENSGVKPEVIVTKGSTLLLEGTDYTVSYKNNKKLAKKTDEKAPEVIVKGKGKYKGSASVRFSISKKDLKDSEDKIQIVSADKLINKNGKYQSAPVVTDSKGKKLKLNKDYKILGYYVGESELPTVQKDLVKGTTVKVKIEGMGNYTGPAETTYRIVEKNLSKVKVKIKDQNYTGEAITFTEEDFINGTIIVTPPKGSEPLVYGVDYVIDEESYQNHVKKGTAKVTLKGISDTWGGTKTVKYTIKVKQVQ